MISGIARKRARTRFRKVIHNLSESLVPLKSIGYDLRCQGSRAASPARIKGARKGTIKGASK